MSKRLVVVVCCVDSWEVTAESIEYLLANRTPELTEIILLDNGSYTKPTEGLLPIGEYKIIRFENNRGGNSIFHRLMPELDQLGVEFVWYQHNDVMVREENWDERVVRAFDRDPKLACLGIVGSDEIDMAGGRGLGTTSSYMGYEYRTIWASPAEIHGRRSIGTEAAGVLDHCVMAFRVSMLKQLPAQDENNYHTPGHFYDRVLCCEMIQRGWHIATIGIQADHASGGIGMCKVPGEQVGLKNRDDFYKVWLEEREITYDPERLDQAIYVESERRYLGKWRDTLHFIPYKVGQDYVVRHTHPKWKE